MEAQQQNLHHKCKRVVRKYICGGSLEMYGEQNLWTPSIAAYKKVLIFKCIKCNHVIREEDK